MYLYVCMSQNGIKESFGLAQSFLKRLCGDVYNDVSNPNHSEFNLSLLSSHHFTFFISPIDDSGYEALNLQASPFFKERYIIVVDLTSEKRLTTIKEQLERIKVISKSFNKQISVTIVGMKSDELQELQLQQKKLEIEQCTKNFIENNLGSNVGVNGIFIVSAKANEGFNPILELLLVEKLFEELNIFYNKGSKEIIDGFEAIMSTLKDHTLNTEQQLQKIVAICSSKKGDYTFTRFLHSKIRDRQPATEGVYQMISRLSVNPLRSDQIVDVIDALRRLNPPSAEAIEALRRLRQPSPFDLTCPHCGH